MSGNCDPIWWYSVVADWRSGSGIFSANTSVRTVITVRASSGADTLVPAVAFFTAAVVHLPRVNLEMSSFLKPEARRVLMCP